MKVVLRHFYWVAVMGKAVDIDDIICPSAGVRSIKDDDVLEKLG